MKDSKNKISSTSMPTAALTSGASPQPLPDQKKQRSRIKTKRYSHGAISSKSDSDATPYLLQSAQINSGSG